jgi:hypothetical protein
MFPKYLSLPIKVYPKMQVIILFVRLKIPKNITLSIPLLISMLKAGQRVDIHT